MQTLTRWHAPFTMAQLQVIFLSCVYICSMSAQLRLSKRTHLPTLKTASPVQQSAHEGHRACFPFGDCATGWHHRWSLNGTPTHDWGKFMGTKRKELRRLNDIHSNMLDKVIILLVLSPSLWAA